MKCEYCEGTGLREESTWFWETDGIYDKDGDLLALSLIGVTFYSLQVSMYFGSEFYCDLWEEFYE